MVITAKLLEISGLLSLSLALALESSADRAWSAFDRKKSGLDGDQDRKPGKPFRILCSMYRAIAIFFIYKIKTKLITFQRGRHRSAYL